MNCFCVKKKRMRTGMIANTDAAISCSYAVPISLEKTRNPTGTVRIFGLVVMISTQVNEFQLPKNLNKSTVKIAGLESGTMMVNKKRKREHPSIRAASSSSSGTPLKNCLSKKMPNTETNQGMIRAQYVSSHPRRAIVT